MTVSSSQREGLNSVTSVIRDPLRFKIKLDIGEDAYTSLRLKKYFLDAVDAANGAFTGAGIASTSVVASTFFTPSGILGAIGIGAATTPLGWAITAGVVGAGLSVALGKYFVRGSSSRVHVIPEFINTPLDILAVSLFDLIGMLSIKVASVDGHIADSEMNVIERYFTEDWGYDSVFVSKGLLEIKEESENHTISAVAQKVADYKKGNPDCNYDSMSKEIIRFLQEISEADGTIDEREEMAIERIERIFNEVGSSSIPKVAKAGFQAAKATGIKGVEAVTKGIADVGENIKSLSSNLRSKTRKRNLED